MGLGLTSCGDDAVEPVPPDPPVPTTVTIAPESAILRLPGETVQLIVTVQDQYGQAMSGVTVAWTSSDVSVATVSASGVVTATAVGTVTVTATAGSASGSSEVTVEEHPDRSALVALYNSAEGPNWVNSKNWLTNAPLGDWAGVETDANGRVVALSLVGWWDNVSQQRVPYGLQGPIPSEIGGLSELEELHLGSNDLTGSIPPELGGLAKLEELDLANNDLSGTIPSELATLADLRSLSLGGNQLSGEIPPELGDLANLRMLSLDSNQLSGEIPLELGGLTALEGLYLSGNQLSGRDPAGTRRLDSLGRTLPLGESSIGPDSE